MNGRFTKQIEEWIDRALEKHSLGDRFIYEMNFNPTPPNLALVMFHPGMIFGTWIHTSVVIENVLTTNEDEIEDMIQQLLEGLRDARAQQGIEATNGHGGEVSADIVP